MRYVFDVLCSDFKSLTTFKYHFFCAFLEGMTADSLRTLRLKIHDSAFRNGYYPEYDFRELVLKFPLLELIELTINRYGVVGSSLETLKWEKH